MYLAPNGDVEVRFGLGSGSVGPPQSFGSNAADSAYARIELLDVDGSGAADVLMINLVQSWLQALVSDGAGCLTASQTVSTEGSTAVKGVEPFQIAGGDLDNDGTSDVVVASTGGLLSQKVFPLTVSVFRGGASSTPTILDEAGDRVLSPSAIEVLGDIYFPYGLEVEDLNGDGVRDILVVAAKGDAIAIATLLATP